ncbi:MAG: S-adenosyl-l-methionine hydroxide adenosyltransferase family protein [Leptolyngbyaceae cyanobacterium]
MPTCITLLTDFGLQDPYVGVMKGAIATICPQATVIDLTHQISPQDIAAARFALLSAYPYFPQGTIHTVVVDPGVGTARRAIALRTESDYLVGPDNGVFSGVIQHHGVEAAVTLTNPEYWRSPKPSQTFHGRDIFAPVAAHLAAGVAFADLGPAIALDTLVTLEMPPPVHQSDGIVIGQIQAIDYFGNLITNLDRAIVAGHGSIVLGPHVIPLDATYSAVPVGSLVALIGSHGWLEVACNGSRAQAECGAQVGDRVYLQGDQSILPNCIGEIEATQ